MPKVSVIIPVYNVEKYLRECLDSVINQTLRDIEIICINDGSTDNSLTILKEYASKDDRIRILNQKNKGAGSARNVGLRQCSGEYIAFLDGDDFYNPDFCEKMYKKAISTQSDIAICQAQSYNIKTKETKILLRSLVCEYLPNKEVFSANDMPEYIFNSFQNWNWNKIFKTSFIKNANIKFQELYRTNDLYFTCCALVLANRISVIKEALINHRVGMVTNSQSTNYLYPFDFYEAFKALRLFLREKDLYKIYRNSYINWTITGFLHGVHSIQNIDIQKQIIKKIFTNGIKDLGFEEIDKYNIPIYKQTAKEKYINYKNQYTFGKLLNIFSIQSTWDGKHKVYTILGVRIKIKRRSKSAKG